MSNLNLTETNFTKKLGNWVKGSKSKRDELQEFIVFGVLHAQENDNDFTMLTNVMVACEDVKAFPNNDVCDYIKKVIAGITWKTNDKVFKRANKKAKVEYSIGYLESETWYEFSKATNVVTEVDFQRGLTTFMKRMRKALEDGKLKEGQEDAVTDFLNDSMAFLK